MELPHLGQACVICRRNDYLPFKCPHCDKIVCIDHKTNHGVECRLNNINFDISPDDCHSRESLKQSCDYCKKITLKLELVECIYCKSQYCLYHRHQVQHNCRQLIENQETMKKEAEERSTRQKVALNKLKETRKSTAFTSNTSSITSQPLDPKKRDLAKRIRVMKIKQSARGPPNILIEDKIYFEIRFVHEPQSSLSNKAKHGNNIRVFTTPNHTIGRMIDWSAGELGITNKNHLPGDSQLIFQKQNGSSESITLDSQVCFSLYLNDGKLENGDEIVLTYSKS